MSKSYTVAIEEMYLAFSSVERPLNIQVDTPYITPEQVQLLIDTPLRELDWELLELYDYSAPKLLGTEKDYLYYLPRLVELTVNGTYDIFRICKKAGTMQELTHSQRKALENVLSAVWLEELNINPRELGAKDAIKTIAQVILLKISPKNLLRRWLESDAMFVNGHLAFAIQDYAQSIAHNKQVYFLLDGDTDASRLINSAFQQEILPFLNTPEVNSRLRLLRDAPVACEDEEIFQAAAIYALSFLETHKKTP